MQEIWTKNELGSQLREMGLLPSDSVMLHSSMKAIGNVQGGADTVVDVFMEYLSDGLFITPTHTWKQMSSEYRIFDPVSEPACVGIIPNIFMRRPGVCRSLHPTHSIAAFGKGAEEYVKGDDCFSTPCDPRGCFGRLRDIGAKILLAGVTHTKNTYIHSIEESMDIPERLTAQPTLFIVRMSDGSLKEVPMYRHYNRKMAHISESFDKLKDYYFKLGAAKKVTLGSADSILCDTRALFDATVAVLSRQPDFFIPDTIFRSKSVPKIIR